MIDLGGNRYFDVVLCAYVCVVLTVLTVPPFLAWKRWNR